MADTGFRDPTATGDDYNEWGDPTNAFSSNDIRAQVGYRVVIDEQDYYNFGFSIPAGATIDGIHVDFEGYIPVGTINVNCKLSWDGGTSWTAVKILTLNTVEQYHTVGGATDTWGRTWVVSEFSNVNFRFYGQGDDGRFGYCDHIRIKVFYTEAAGVSRAFIMSA